MCHSRNPGQLIVQLFTLRNKSYQAELFKVLRSGPNIAALQK